MTYLEIVQYRSSRYSELRFSHRSALLYATVFQIFSSFFFQRPCFKVFFKKHYVNNFKKTNIYPTSYKFFKLIQIFAFLIKLHK